MRSRPGAPFFNSRNDRRLACSALRAHLARLRKAVSRTPARRGRISLNGTSLLATRAPGRSERLRSPVTVQSSVLGPGGVDDASHGWSDIGRADVAEPVVEIQYHYCPGGADEPLILAPSVAYGVSSAPSGRRCGGTDPRVPRHRLRRYRFTRGKRRRPLQGPERMAERLRPPMRTFT